MTTRQWGGYRVAFQDFSHYQGGIFPTGNYIFCDIISVLDSELSQKYSVEEHRADFPEVLRALVDDHVLIPRYAPDFAQQHNIPLVQKGGFILPEAQSFFVTAPGDELMNMAYGFMHDAACLAYYRGLERSVRRD